MKFFYKDLLGSVIGRGLAG